jgi:hypothetical protein
MTAGLRRGPRRRKPYRVSNRLAAFWSDRTENLGAVTANLLGEDWF